MKSTLLIKKEIVEAIMAESEFQRGYNAFSGVDLKSAFSRKGPPMELDPEMAKLAQPWLDKAMIQAFSYLCERVRVEIPGMKEAGMERVIEHTIAHMIKAWGDHRAMMVQYSKLMDSFDFKNMPYLGDPLGRLMDKEIAHFKLDYPLRQLAGVYSIDNQPTTCSICGKEKCEHLQTLLADDKEGGVIDALFEEDSAEADNPGRPDE
jgi:hypothetical protein